LQVRQNGVFTVNVVPDSPATHVGVVAGCRVQAVDGVELAPRDEGWGWGLVARELRKTGVVSCEQLCVSSCA
jgi:hypothetical protein